MNKIYMLITLSLIAENAMAICMDGVCSSCDGGVCKDTLVDKNEIKSIESVKNTLGFGANGGRKTDYRLQNLSSVGIKT